MAVHVFWDNSNIWIGLQALCRKLENIPPVALRVSLRNIEDYVVRDRVTGQKVIAGSYPPECAELLQVASSLGYDTSFMYRIEDSKKMREQGVDMRLHLAMSTAILDSEKSEVMVVLTGDSHDDPDSKTSFVAMIERALKRGWTVEVYAVRDTLSETTYRPLLEKYKNELQIYYLDDVYYEITYIVEGDFYFQESPENIIHVNKRESHARSWRW